ncbi:MAG: hypothetical protein JWQ71_2469 [Pedosphaera sp.]|nr:hypothetical protein [Pedosphaera sp.]
MKAHKNNPMHHLTKILSLLIILGGFSSAFAKSTPNSALELVNKVSDAVKAKDTNAYMALINWDGVSDKYKTMTGKIVADCLMQEFRSIELAPLPVSFPLTNEMNGVRYTPNLKVLGLVAIKFRQTNTTHNSVSEMKLPYGQKDGGFYLSGVITERFAPPLTNARPLNIVVEGSGSPDAGEFTGSYVFLQNGREVKGELSSKGNVSKSFWGDYIKSCTVQKISGSDAIKLVISEDAREVFSSPMVESKDPIIYQRK